MEPGMGIEPTSAIALFYTAGRGKATAARRLNRSAIGDRRFSALDQPRLFSPALKRSSMEL